MGRRPLGPDGSWGVSVLCSSRVLTQQRPLRHHWKEMHWLPSGRLPAAFQPATSDFQCLPHALESGDRLKWECQGGLVVSPRWLRPMQTGCFMAIIKWIKIIKIPSSKEDTLFFFYVLIRSFGLLFSSILCYIDRMHFHWRTARLSTWTACCGS